MNINQPLTLNNTLGELSKILSRMPCENPTEKIVAKCRTKLRNIPNSLFRMRNPIFFFFFVLPGYISSSSLPDGKKKRQQNIVWGFFWKLIKGLKQCGCPKCMTTEVPHNIPKRIAKRIGLNPSSVGMVMEEFTTPKPTETNEPESYIHMTSKTILTSEAVKPLEEIVKSCTDEIVDKAVDTLSLELLNIFC